ncbi:CD81 antigen-like [Xyrauchen texanus]|uniref:CD81 antigen-like n=1 Tax=Xyrauchen texanus TaxID=154827 RepID=UPI00224236AB|nr:CD81 antigen-like [Xyrauchen texanus]
MVVTGCSQCIKYMLFFFNFIFWLAGGVILGVALWLRHDSQTSNLLMLQFEGNQAPGTFYVSVYVLIAIGALMMFVGFLGCYGAIQESQCLLGTFFTCLVILFACEVAAGLWGFINKDTISTELINFYDTAYIKAVDPVGTESKQAATKILEVFHETLECCGKGDNNELFKAAQTSLCPKMTNPIDLLITQSCHTKLRNLFTEKLHVIGLAALVIAVIMVFEMIFTMVLCCAIRNTPAY